MYPRVLFSAMLAAASLPAHATLTSVDNGLGVYDSVLDVTWTADANLLGTLEAANPNLIATIVNDNDVATAIFTAYGHTLAAGDFGAGGLVNWWGAQAFVAYLNDTNYGNSKQWALPTSNAVYGYNQTASQLGELFYTGLGGTADTPIPDSAYFTNEQALAYWSGTESSGNTGDAWAFDTSVGYQYYRYKPTQFYAWAVSPGQVAAAAASVPEPSMAALMLTGFGLLGWMRRFRAG